MAYKYTVVSPGGYPVMVTEDERCRYKRETERSLLEAGYVIRVNGKRMSKKDAKE